MMLTNRPSYERYFIQSEMKAWKLLAAKVAACNCDAVENIKRSVRS